jgi:UDP-N-acetylglucosamine 2-epimerase (non-hydrolysing)
MRDAPTSIVHVVGGRRDLVTLQPVIDALERLGAFRQLVVYTGRTGDGSLPDQLLSELRFPAPQHVLGVGSGTSGVRTARALLAFEPLLEELQPGLVVVTGDGDGALACAVAASKLSIPLAHVQAGMRSRDWTVAEEINALLIDRVADTLFTNSREAEENLLDERVDDGAIHFVGSPLIDSLRRWERRAVTRATWRDISLEEREYVLVSLHHPARLGGSDRHARVVAPLVALARETPVVLALHPRTGGPLQRSGALRQITAAGVRCIEPGTYLDFLSLQAGAGAIVTDSGAVQEEASALGVSCFTCRATTERSVTLTRGTNHLLGDDLAEIAHVRPSPHPRTPCAIPLWDGHAGERVADVLVTNYALSRVAGGG